MSNIRVLDYVFDDSGGTTTGGGGVVNLDSLKVSLNVQGQLPVDALLVDQVAGSIPVDSLLVPVEAA